MQFYVVFAEVSRHFVRNLHLVHEQDALRGREVGKAHGYGVVSHIVASNVEQPRQFVERAHEYGVASLCDDGLLHVGPFFVKAFAAVCRRVDEGFARGHAGASLPNLVEGGKVGLEPEPFALEISLHAFAFAVRTGRAVDGYGRSRRECGCQPGLQRRCFGQSLFEQLQPRCLQLLGCLQEIARVGPHAAVGGCDYGGPGRAGEARNPSS